LLISTVADGLLQYKLNLGKCMKCFSVICALNKIVHTCIENSSEIIKNGSAINDASDVLDNIYFRNNWNVQI
jgi:hypothetical protein